MLHRKVDVLLFAEGLPCREGIFTHISTSDSMEIVFSFKWVLIGIYLKSFLALNPVPLMLTQESAQWWQITLKLPLST